MTPHDRFLVGSARDRLTWDAQQHLLATTQDLLRTAEHLADLQQDAVRLPLPSLAARIERLQQSLRAMAGEVRLEKERLAGFRDPETLLPG
ncbi:MAG: hypothetical protein ACK44L_08655 [Burkholderiales bacterium]